MSEPRRAEADDARAEPEERSDLELPAAGARDVASLAAQGDIAGLLQLARGARSGAMPGGRDMKRCFEAYRAASTLGSGEAAYAVALFCMTGGAVPQDLKEGAAQLRIAAERGSLPAKIYLGNLYELGVHYGADPEKADVWYRNAARGAGVEAAPGTDAYAFALAELGCARYVRAVIERDDVSAEDKARILQRARAHGYGLRVKNAEETAPSEGATAEGARAHGGSDPSPSEQPRSAPRDEEGSTRPKAPSRTILGLGAFAYAVLFEAAGIGAGYAATLGARALAERGMLLPGIGARTELVFPIVLAFVGVLPTCLVYRVGTVLKALTIAGVFGGIGWVAWGTGQAAFHPDRAAQAFAFGVGGFLAGLLVLGILGGTKRAPRGR